MINIKKRFANTPKPDVNLTHPTKTLLDIRGSILVSHPQNFDVIRQQVINTHIRQRLSNGK